MGYLCTHGEILSSCSICVEFEDELEFMLEEMDIQDTRDYIYDYYLDQDERSLREEDSE